jgi:transcription elongation factor Elf1
LSKKRPKNQYKKIREKDQERKARDTANEQKSKERQCPRCGKKDKISIRRESSGSVVVSCAVCGQRFEDYRTGLSDADYYHSFLDDFEKTRNLSPIERRQRRMERYARALRELHSRKQPRSE